MNKIPFSYYIYFLGTICYSILGTMDSSALSPKNIKGTLLTKRNEMPLEQREVLDVVASELKKENEPETDYYAEIDPVPKDGHTVIHLWHKSAFEPKNEMVLGNPGGKSRDLYYDLKTKKITKSLLWQ